MNTSTLWLKTSLILCLSCLTSLAYGQNIYKSIDETGKVSYTSSEPVDMNNVQTLAPPPEPTPEALAAAKQRLAEYEQQSQQREQARIEQQLAEAQSKQATERIVERQVIPVPLVRSRPLLRPRPLPIRPPGIRP